MTSNEKQIDILLRRYAKAAPRANAGEHLDADELSAFADGALPPATRARYISHLADCDHCREQASALAISSGAVVRAEQRKSEITEGRTFWQLLAGLFALPLLRYGALAAVLLIIAAVAFVALRRPRQESQLIAANERVEQERSAVKPPGTMQDSDTHNKQANIETRGVSPSQPVAGKDQSATKADGTQLAKEAPVIQAPMKEAAASSPAVNFGAAKKAGEGQFAQAAPSYAPLPPAEATLKQQEAYREQQRAAAVSGPRQQQQKYEQADKLATLDRERDVAKDAKDAKRMDEGAPTANTTPSVASNQAPRNRAANEKAKGPMRNMENNAIFRSVPEDRAEAPKTSSKSVPDNRASTEEVPQTRSAGGKKFRRQGNAWVDQKFKSSMTLRSISRGSEEFAALDSGLRSIAQQLGGEVIIVSKGKAYLIK
ncbi:MAG TPA: zf-HC2 domain-containing protein [Pyrinomonadaceae bacterium]|nr:zf-HC2 domain-containing protein [Pyrinomonadaceae bacterium]